MNIAKQIKFKLFFCKKSKIYKYNLFILFLLNLPIIVSEDDYRIWRNGLDYIVSKKVIVQSTSEPMIPPTIGSNNLGSTLTSSPTTEARKREEHEIIAELIDTIDQLYQKISDLISELARRMKENMTCKPNQICIRIKDKLRHKIKEGKITGRWTEKILPLECKRKYTRPKTSLFSSENKGEQHSTSFESKKDIGPIKKRFDISNREAMAGLYNLSEEGLHIPQGELEVEAILQGVLAALQISDTRLEFSIPANKYESVIIAMKNSKNKSTSYSRVEFSNTPTLIVWKLMSCLHP